MIAICTGISGVGKREYLQKLKEFHPDKISKMFDVGELMLHVAKQLNIDTSTEKILDMPDTTKTALRSTIFEQILGELHEADPTKHYLISLHASFRWNQVLALGFNAYYLNRITELAREKEISILYVCFTDTICKTFARLQGREQWREKLSMEEVLLWSNEETVLTKMIAEYGKVDFVLLPTEEPIDSLWHILENPSKKKLYLSFPITIKKTQPEFFEEVNQFRDRLREDFVVFDPLAIKDLEWLAGDYQLPEELKGGAEAKFPTPNEVTDLCKGYMASQTVTRDFQLIDQADFVVVYYRTHSVSFGVISEMIHGHTNNKPVYVVWSGSVSPFFSYYCADWKNDIDALIQLLKERYSAPA
jgi:adenylate kinase